MYLYTVSINKSTIKTTTTTNKKQTNKYKQKKTERKTKTKEFKILLTSLGCPKSYFNEKR